MSIESARARLNAAQPERWTIDESFHRYNISRSLPRIDDTDDVEFIIHAPTDMAAALKVIERAKAEHTMGEPDGDGCRFCSCGISDCPTAFEVEAFEALP